ncbi:hypothetical protein SEVIR_1G048950v4 [Setaria viridis]
MTPMMRATVPKERIDCPVASLSTLDLFASQAKRGPLLPGLPSGRPCYPCPPATRTRGQGPPAIHPTHTLLRAFWRDSVDQAGSSGNAGSLIRRKNGRLGWLGSCSGIVSVYSCRMRLKRLPGWSVLARDQWRSGRTCDPVSLCLF